MSFIKLILGILFLFLGWIYFYKPNLVVNINRIIRETFFNDKHTLLKRKKLAILFFCLSFIALYMGFTSMARKIEKQEKDTWLMENYKYSMYIATQDYYLKKYNSALKRYKRILNEAPDKKEVLKWMAIVYSEMGERIKAKALFQKLLQMSPNDRDIQRELKKLTDSKTEIKNSKNKKQSGRSK